MRRLFIVTLTLLSLCIGILAMRVPVAAATPVTPFLQGAALSDEFDCTPPANYDSLVNSLAAWQANTLKVTVNPMFLTGQQGCNGASYLASVEHAATLAESRSMTVILGMYPMKDYYAGYSYMPTQTTVNAWAILAPIYKNDPRVLYEAFNEPHTITDQVWRDGNAAQGYIGMQALVNDIRALAPNPILVDGPNYSGTIGQVVAAGYRIIGANVYYAVHVWTNGGNKNPSNWAANFGNLAATTPVYATEFGDVGCVAGNGWMTQFMMYARAHLAGMIAWSFTHDGSVCGRPDLVSSDTGTPSSYGQVVHDTFIESVPTPTATSTPLPTQTPIPPTATPIHAQASCHTTSTQNGKTLTVVTICQLP